MNKHTIEAVIYIVVAFVVAWALIPSAPQTTTAARINVEHVRSPHAGHCYDVITMYINTDYFTSHEVPCRGE